jgi:FkbM family methyltransferase
VLTQIFIDLGANVGAVSKAFAQKNSACEIFCVEPNIHLIPSILAVAAELRRTINIIWSAAWTYDGIIDLYQSDADAASTIVDGKVEHSGWPQIDYTKSQLVPCFDFSSWMLRRFSLYDDITVKMDIEGAEYDLLEKMLRDGSIRLVRKLICEWHFDRYPAISPERHRILKGHVSSMLSLEEWN